ncbi:MAG: S1C family serine protease, partial [Acidimicrobiia bacterium]
TLTRGIISKADFVGETEWASVDRIVEHDARIRGGNSGGPLVTEEALVVGVNYAGRSDTDQNFAISAGEAREIVEQLRAGNNVDSVGINGFAVADDAGNTGVWVSSVKPGSPADRAGITGGDIVTRLAGVSLGTDGTLADYCDVIRTHRADDVIPVEVLRYPTGEALEGQLNGTPLAVAFVFAEELEDTATVEDGGSAYASYAVIADDTGAIQVEVPGEWSDVDGAPYEDDQGRYIVDVRAASDLDAFHNSWTTPGVIFSASSAWAATTDENSLLDQLIDQLTTQCQYIGRDAYEDPAYVGFFDVYVECGGETATYVIVAARPADGAFLLLVQVQANQERDFEALDRVLGTFVVVGDV